MRFGPIIHRSAKLILYAAVVCFSAVPRGSHTHATGLSHESTGLWKELTATEQYATATTPQFTATTPEASPTGAD